MLSIHAPSHTITRAQTHSHATHALFFSLTLSHNALTQRFYTLSHAPARSLPRSQNTLSQNALSYALSHAPTDTLSHLLTSAHTVSHIPTHSLKLSQTISHTLSHTPTRWHTQGSSLRSSTFCSQGGEKEGKKTRSFFLSFFHTLPHTLSHTLAPAITLYHAPSHTLSHRTISHAVSRQQLKPSC